MIDLNNDKKNNNCTIPVATIFTLALIMTASTIAAPAAATTMPQPVTVATDNQSVNVLISWEPMEIEPGQDTVFTLDFQDPSSGESISHVNYNFEIKDQNGGTVQSMTDLHTHSGSDEQTVTFDTAGSFNVVATIIGTGLDPPFDTTQSGTAQTVITVGQQLAGATDGNNTAGTTDNITATTGGVGSSTGAQSACTPTQMAGGGGGGTNATAGNATTATTGTMTANATTTAGGGGGGGNQTTSSPTQLIEQACIAAQNNDTQGVLMNLNLALNALGGNMTTTTAGTAGGEEGEKKEKEKKKRTSSRTHTYCSILEQKYSFFLLLLLSVNRSCHIQHLIPQANKYHYSRFALFSHSVPAMRQLGYYINKVLTMTMQTSR